LDLAVPQPRRDQHGRVRLRADIVVGRIRQHVVVGLSVRWIAPLVVFVGGEGDGVVQHGGDDVHERHLSDDAAVVLRTDVGDGAHQQAAGASAHREYLVLGSESLVHQEMRDIDEVGEGIFFCISRPSSYHARPIS